MSSAIDSTTSSQVGPSGANAWTGGSGATQGGYALNAAVSSAPNTNASSSPDTSGPKISNQSHQDAVLQNLYVKTGRLAEGIQVFASTYQPNSRHFIIRLETMGQPQSSVSSQMAAQVSPSFQEGNYYFVAAVNMPQSDNGSAGNYSGENMAVAQDRTKVPQGKNSGDQADQLIEQFNEYVEFLNQNQEVLKPTITGAITDTADRHIMELNTIGLQPRGDGRLVPTEIDPTALQNNPEQVVKVLTGEEGFFTDVNTILQGIVDQDPLLHAVGVDTTPLTYQATAAGSQTAQAGLRVSTWV